MKKKLFSVIFAITLICTFSSVAFASSEKLSQAGEIAKENASEVPEFSISFDENNEFNGFDIENAEEKDVENGIDEFDEFNNEDFPEFDEEDFDFEDYFEKDENVLTEKQKEKMMDAIESNPLFLICIAAESTCIILFIPLLILLTVFIVLNSKQKKKIKEYERRIATGFGIKPNNGIRTVQFGSQQFNTQDTGGYTPYNNTGYASENGAYNKNGTSPVNSDGNKQNTQENDETGGNENE